MWIRKSILMETYMKKKCPKCGKDLVKTETGLWCESGCYGTEYELWVAMGQQERG
jgi:ribosomal protein L37AE/L43A